MPLKRKMDEKQRLVRKNAFDGNLIKGGVGAFFKNTGRDKHKEKIEKEVKRYAEPDTGLLRNELSRYRSCPLCEGKESSIAFVKEGFPHVKCRCGMFYVNPILHEERLHSYYMDEDSWNLVLSNELQVRLDELKFNYGLDVLESCLERRGRLLDVGAGPGVFLKQALTRGWKVHAVEFNSVCVAKLKELGIGVTAEPLQQANLEAGSFDVASMWDVLEHIVDPASLLKSLHDLLCPGGLLLISVPNADGLAARILQEKCVVFGGQSHVNFFGANTMRRMLQATGFEILEMETLLTDLETIRNYMDYEPPYSGSSEASIPFLTPEYLHENLLGSKLFTVARSV